MTITAEGPEAAAVPDEVLDLVDEVTRNLYHGSARVVVDRTDLRQELLVWVLDQADNDVNFLTAVADEPELACSSLENCGRRYIDRERIAVSDYLPVRHRRRGAVSIERVERLLLPAVFVPERWNHPPEGEGGADWIDELAECGEAFRRLDGEARRLIERRFRDGASAAQIAAASGLDVGTVEEALSSATARVRDDTSGDLEPDPDAVIVGTRRVISNAAAIAITRNEGGRG